jgi:hypothetical protein
MFFSSSSLPSGFKLLSSVAKTLSGDEAMFIRHCATTLLEAIPAPMPDQTLLLPFVTVD